MFKTFIPKTTDIKRQWIEIDASQFTLGRLATKVATILRGKHKANFTPHMDMGDFVVVINASKVKLTGRKLLQKEYIRYSGYPGGIRRKSMQVMMEQNPEKVIYAAVRSMLPTNRLRRLELNRLRVFSEASHKLQIDKKISN